MAKSPVRAKQRNRAAARQNPGGSRAVRVFAPTRARQLGRGIGKITSYLAGGGATPGMQELVANVDFPGFVSKLIEGTFNAIVDASIEQMEAYGQLVKDVTRAIDQFAKDDASAEQARDWLTAKYPDLLDDDDDKKTARARRKRFTQKQRRRLVAKATLMGINRVVVTSAVQRAKR